MKNEKTIYELYSHDTLTGEYDCENDALAAQLKFADDGDSEIRFRELNAFEDISFEEALEIISEASEVVGVSAVARLIKTPDVTVRTWLRKRTGRLKPTQKLRIVRLSRLID